jgi:hypothetical protein
VHIVAPVALAFAMERPKEQRQSSTASIARRSPTIAGLATDTVLLSVITSPLLAYLGVMIMQTRGLSLFDALNAIEIALSMWINPSQIDKPQMTSAKKSHDERSGTIIRRVVDSLNAQSAGCGTRQRTTSPSCPRPKFDHKRAKGTITQYLLTACCRAIIAARKRIRWRDKRHARQTGRGAQRGNKRHPEVHPSSG